MITPQFSEGLHVSFCGLCIVFLRNHSVQNSPWGRSKCGEYKTRSRLFGVDRKHLFRGSLFGITRLVGCGQKKTDPEGQIFLSTPNSHERFFFLPAFIALKHF